MATTLATPKKEERMMRPLGRGFLADQFGLMRRFSDEMDRLFEDFGFRPRFFEGKERVEMWAPDVEVLERPNQLVIRADLPGLTKEDVKVGILDNVLTLEGERKQETEEKKEGYFRSERHYGAFYRGIPLPENVKADQVQAVFKNGVLEVTLPLIKEEKKAKTVEIKAA